MEKEKQKEKQKEEDSQPKKKEDNPEEKPAENIIAERLKAKEQELELREEKLKKAREDFREFVNNTEIGGSSILGKELSEEEKKQQEVEEVTSKYMKAVGFKK